MTHTPAGVELSPGAAARFEEYLRQVRAALAGVADVNPDEIEADIREHVENELRAAPRPVPLAALEAVLARLGPPSQWGATDDPGVFRRAKALLGGRLRDARVTLGDRLRAARESLVRGPEDWRLAYLSFGAFALGVLTFFAFPLALLVSYLLSRAGIALAREKGIELGAGRKWLLYPPVVAVSTAILIPLVAWPVGVGVKVTEQVEKARTRISRFYTPHPVPPRRELLQDSRGWRENASRQLEEDRKLLTAIPVAPQWAPVATGLFVGGGLMLVWWTILGGLAAALPQTARAVFLPLLNRFERRHGLWLAIPCLGLSVIWCTAAWEVVTAAGLI